MVKDVTCDGTITNTKYMSFKWAVHTTQNPPKTSPLVALIADHRAVASDGTI